MIEWSEELSVGNKKIDNEHKALISFINKLNDHIARGENKLNITKTFNGLFDYAKIHFANEEKLMRSTGYPEYMAHKNKHDDFRSELQDLHRSYTDKQGNVTPKEILFFLQRWLINHIKVEDKKYAPHLV